MQRNIILPWQRQTFLFSVQVNTFLLDGHLILKIVRQMITQIILVNLFFPFVNDCMERCTSSMNQQQLVDLKFSYVN
jgi:hypothetical protein